MNDYTEISAHSLPSSHPPLPQVLHDPSYRAAAVRLSKVVHDSPVSAMDAAMWLLEHVINTRGAAHLKMPGR